MSGLPPGIAEQVRIALAEDVGAGDITAGLIDETANAQAQVLVREDAVLCGCAWFEEVFSQLDQRIHVQWLAADGDLLTTGSKVCTLAGPARAILTGERTALNFLQTLSATATVTRHYVNVIADRDTKILDTRKTLPGLRAAQKYAVACGGGHNHRMGLFDAILIKENHIAACGGITPAIKAAQREQVPVEIEVESLEQLQEALEASIDIVLLDNFTLDELREAVSINQSTSGGKCKLEASGSVDEKSLRAIAETGVDYISIGALTKNIRAIDFSMTFIR